MNRFNGLLVAMLVVLLARAENSVFAATYFVSSCGQDAWAGVDPNCAPPLGPKRTVQAAVNAASDGDTILVFPGTYVGTVDLDGKAVHLVSATGPGATFLDGGGAQRVLLCNSGEGTDTVIEGFTIRNGFTADDGGGMLIALSSPTIIDCVFLNNDADRGGAVASFTSSPTFIGAQFVSNSAGSGGGAYFSGGQPELTGCDFIGNAAPISGAGVYFANSAHGVVDDCTFQSNTITATSEGSAGGGVSIFQASAEISNSVFQLNDGSVIGGGVAVQGSSGSAIISGSTFHNNTATAGGGIGAWSSETTIIGCSFTENTAENGGAISATNGGDVSITFSGFSDNDATGGNSTGGGGAIRTHSITLDISGSTFFQNVSQAYGGAISASYGTTDVTGAVFTSNLATLDRGGAIWIQHGDARVTGATFTDNGASAEGGGIAYFREDDTFADNSLPDGLTVSDSMFVDNGALEGGGVAILQGPALIENSTFEECGAADTGGGIHTTSGGDVLISNSQFINGNALGGAGIGVDSGSPIIESCSFIGGLSWSGAGVFAVGVNANPLIHGCRFEGNEATMNGAAIGVGFSGATGGRAMVVNSIVVNNTAPFGTGAIAVVDPVGVVHGVEVHNSVIADNTGGGVFIDNPMADVVVSNSIVWGNTNGDEIGGGPALVRHSVIDGGFAGVGNLSANPMFVNAAVGNYRLQAISPAIDAGDNGAVPIDERDVDADGNTSERFPIDFEGAPRFQNHAAMNTGCGGGAIVDIGPFEAPGVPVENVHPADQNGDGVVNGADLASLLSQWGVCAGCCLADLNGDGVVDGIDLASMLASWSA